MTNLEIIRSFRQGGTGNCVSIAIIKAGIEIFGLNQIFHSQLEDSGNYNFMLRDGFQSTISPQEYEQAVSGSMFQELANKEIYDYAVLCYAVMAKRAMIEGNDQQDNLTYQQAIATLNNGENYLQGPYWLGLRHNYRNIGRRYARTNPGCVGASRAHCFYVSYGMEDQYGVPDHIGLLERNFVHWYRLTTEQIF